MFQTGDDSIFAGGGGCYRCETARLLIIIALRAGVTVNGISQSGNAVTKTTDVEMSSQSLKFIKEDVRGEQFPPTHPECLYSIFTHSTGIKLLVLTRKYNFF